MLSAVCSVLCVCVCVKQQRVGETIRACVHVHVDLGVCASDPEY